MIRVVGGVGAQQMMAGDDRGLPRMAEDSRELYGVVGDSGAW